MFLLHLHPQPATRVFTRAMAMGPVSMRSEVRPLLTLALPLIASSMLSFLMTLVDLRTVGQLGPHELAAAAMGNLLWQVIQHPCLGCATALDTLLSQAFGAKQMSAYGLHTQTGLLVMLVLSLPFMLILSIAGPVLLAVGVEAALADSAGLFCNYLVMGVPPFFVFQVLTKHLQAQSILAPAVLVGTVCNLANAFGNWFLVFHLDLGFRGAPLATTASRWLQCILLGLYTLLAREQLRPTLPPCHLQWRQLPHRVKQFLALGAPGAAMMSFEAWFFEIATLLASFLGTIALDAHVVMLNICAFTFLSFPFALGIAASIRVGHTLGSGQPAAAKATSNLTFALILTFMTTLAIVKVACRQFLGRIFTSDPAVVAKVASLALCAAVFQISDGTQAAAAGVMRGMGRQATVAWLNLIGFWVLGLGVGVFLTFGLHLGVEGLWWGMAVGLTCTSVLACVMLMRTDWEAQARAAKSRSNTIHSSSSNQNNHGRSTADEDSVPATPSAVETVVVELSPAPDPAEHGVHGTQQNGAEKRPSCEDDGVRLAHALP